MCDLNRGFSTGILYGEGRYQDKASSQHRMTGGIYYDMEGNIAGIRLV